MPPKPSKPTPTKSTNEIFKDPANDILLCSSDNVTFPFRKLHLESASEVFEGMLSVGREGPRKKRRFDSDALEVVDLAEEANLLEKYLIFLHPRVEDPDIVEFEELEQCVASSRLVCPSAISADCQDAPPSIGSSRSPTSMRAGRHS
jgi:hypothetical protein